MTTQLATSLQARGLRPVTELAADREHGDRLRYMAGCRCIECRRANTAYERERQKARKNGDWNGIVSAKNARAHLLKLSKQGIGRRAVQAVTDISDTVLSAIRSGAKKQVRARTERKILAVTKDMASDNALTSAVGTWKLINKLLEKGFTKTLLAYSLGYKTHALQIGKTQVTVRNAYEVRRLYEKLEANNFADAVKMKSPPVVDSLPKNTFQPKPGVLVHTMGD